MGVRRIQVSYEALYGLLRLPEGGQIKNLGQDFTDQVSERFQVLIDHPDLPDSQEGELYPELAMPSYYFEDDGRVYFASWGIAKPDVNSDQG